MECSSLQSLIPLKYCDLFYKRQQKRHQCREWAHGVVSCFVRKAYYVLFKLLHSSVLNQNGGNSWILRYWNPHQMYFFVTLSIKFRIILNFISHFGTVFFFYLLGMKSKFNSSYTRTFVDCYRRTSRVDGWNFNERTFCWALRAFCCQTNCLPFTALAPHLLIWSKVHFDERRDGFHFLMQK